MTVRAVLRDGTEVDLHPDLGATVPEMMRGLSEDSLTGSATPLAEAKLRTATGEEISYSDVNTFVQVDSFA